MPKTFALVPGKKPASPAKPKHPPNTTSSTFEPPRPHQPKPLRSPLIIRQAIAHEGR
jgi:hypothetical protein